MWSGSYWLLWLNVSIGHTHGWIMWDSQPSVCVWDRAAVCFLLTYFIWEGSPGSSKEYHNLAVTFMLGIHSIFISEVTESITLVPCRKIPFNWLKGKKLRILINIVKKNTSVSHLRIIILHTRKSSYVNARGIPTAAYQVLPEVGYPPYRGTPQPGLMGGTRGEISPHQGTPQARSDKGCTQGGVPPLLGYPPGQVWQGGTQGGVPHQGTPRPGPMEVPEVWQGDTRGGVPPVRYPWQGYPPVQPGRGTPPPRCGQTDRWMDGWMDGQTRVKT